MNDSPTVAKGAANPADQYRQLSEQQQSVINKLFRRVIIFLFVLFVFSFLDRINIGFAGLTVGKDLGLNATMFGLATTLFYVTYVIFGIPSNIILGIVGA
ncbi:4-hydroxyphenylacetate permease, partial [Salmonella enterica subsp. enterica serovar Florida]|nr:4-hydroxyphenylacetate permease [Salmonella enterica subsp. enterica serovar Florida]